MPVRRFDTAPIKATKTPAGFLKGEANLTRTGVFTYRNADGSTRRELRLADEVFNADSLDSLALAPMTLNHPDGAVTAENAKQLSIGTVGQAQRADRFVRAPYIINDGEAIKAVIAGKQQLSCGYACDLEMKSGNKDGEEYDAIQRNIRYNHVAIVDVGRAGAEVRLDSADAVCIDSDKPSNPKNEGKPMIKLNIDGVDIEVSEQAAQIIRRAQMKLDEQVKSLTADVATAKADLAKATGRADSLDTEVKKLKADAAPEAIAKAVAARVSLVSQVSPVLAETDAKGTVVAFNADGKSDDELKRAVIMKLQPKADLTGKTADYITARFDSAMESFQSTTTNSDAVTAANADTRRAISNADGAGGSESEKAAKRMRDRNAALWQPAKK